MALAKSCRSIQSIRQRFAGSAKTVGAAVTSVLKDRVSVRTKERVVKDLTARQAASLAVR
ncbi:MAG: hypothetical protein ACXW5W_15795 [Candidatus Binatia bacterium]